MTHILDIFNERKTTFSFEFFPPATDEAAGELFDTIRGMEPLKPSFVSVTYGAGGSTRDRTGNLVLRLKKESALEPIAHLTCVGHTEAEIYDVLEKYAINGVLNILALGGDAPKDDPSYDRSLDAFEHAVDLVRFIRDFADREAGKTIADPRGFGIGVAGFPEGHPGTPNRIVEMDHLKAKVDAGANFIITQLFFDNRDFDDFRERSRLAGITVPIIAGIMPVTSVTGLTRMAELAAGSRFPAKLLRALNRCDGDPESVRNVGVHWATEQCRDLLDSEVDGIHFYTLNKSTATREIYKSLGVKDSIALGK
ncbi:MAG: methylenetetrahydrofolate reductase [NAD(P)H] [Phycisphaeraceae bacterium]|nr:methylenetetrahydrofolate reductase [NAD(P)H] [Phycisphaeraceae bacterium]